MGKWSDEIEKLGDECEEVHTNYHETGAHPEPVIVYDEDGEELLEINPED